MRAVFIKDLSVQDTYEIDGKAHHHLANVVRISEGDELLLLNGQGTSVRTEVQRVSKKNTHLRFLEDQTAQRSFEFDLALGIPKREALELCLKQATELGFRTIYLIRSEFSQTRVPEAERVENILVSALEQSNALFLPEIRETSWEEISWSEYDTTLLLDSQTPALKPGLAIDGKLSNLLVIGPEGGFSAPEINFLHSIPRLKVVKLPTPILRSPTALSVGAGILLQSLLD